MALFLLYGNGPSSSLRIFMLALFALVFTCSFSYCSSSPTYSIGPYRVDIGDNKFDTNRKLYDQNYPYYRLAFEPSSVQDINVPEHPRSLKHRLVNLRTKAALLQADDRPHRQYSTHANNRRYASQSFHAMRG